MKKFNFGNLIFIVAILVVLMLSAGIFDLNMKKDTLKYSTVVSDFEQGKVASFDILGSELTYTLKEDPENPVKNKDDLKRSFKLYSVSLFMQDVGESIAAQRQEGSLEYNIEQEPATPWWVSLLPYVLILVASGVLMYFMYSQFSGGGGKAAAFTKARTRMVSDDKNRVTFADVAGAEEEKEELSEIVDSGGPSGHG